jgi:hypothetical protein
MFVRLGPIGGLSLPEEHADDCAAGGSGGPGRAARWWSQGQKARGFGTWGWLAVPSGEGHAGNLTSERSDRRFSRSSSILEQNADCAAQQLEYHLKFLFLNGFGQLAFFFRDVKPCPSRPLLCDLVSYNSHFLKLYLPLSTPRASQTQSKPN